MPISDWMPGLEQVGALLRARTRNTLGVEVGTFTSDTRPTDEQAQALIDQACEDLTSYLGADVPVCAQNTGKGVAAIGAACLIELSYFPEQINSGLSSYIQLKELYDQRLPQFVALARHCGGTPDDGLDPSAPPRPVSSYPQPCGAPYVGLVTRL